MSAIAFDWMPAEAETKTSVPVKAAENYSRDEEFRLALDRYIASYAAHQTHGAKAASLTAGARHRFEFSEDLRSVLPMAAPSRGESRNLVVFARYNQRLEATSLAPSPERNDRATMAQRLLRPSSGGARPEGRRSASTYACLI